MTGLYVVRKLFPLLLFIPCFHMIINPTWWQRFLMEEFIPNQTKMFHYFTGYRQAVTTVTTDRHKHKLSASVHIKVVSFGRRNRSTCGVLVSRSASIRNTPPELHFHFLHSHQWETDMKKETPTHTSRPSSEDHLHILCQHHPVVVWCVCNISSSENVQGVFRANLN